jgi:hypothetical protein
MNTVWRCRVCEGVNQGGRTCSTCGTIVPRGESARAAVRTRLPAHDPGAPPPVPPTPRRRELREWPRPEEIEIDSLELFGSPRGYEVRPMPGGCLIIGPGPRRRY